MADVEMDEALDDVFDDDAGAFDEVVPGPGVGNIDEVDDIEEDGDDDTDNQNAKQGFEVSTLLSP